MRPSIPSPSPSAAAGTAASSRQTRFLGGLLLAGVGAVLFSAKAIVAKLLYRYQIDAVMVITLRMALAFPIFAVIALWHARHGRPLPRADRWRVVVLGLIGYYLSSFLDFLGLQYITAGLERLILFLTPSFVLLISATVLKKRITRREWLAMATAYAGTVLVFMHDLSLGGRLVWVGGALVLGSAISYGCYLLASGELVRRIGSIPLVSYAMCVSSVACMVQYVVLRPLAQLAQPWPVYGLSLFNAVVCTVAPVFMTMMAVARIGAPSAAQAGMVGPVSTLLLGWWFLGEPITGVQLAGSALVLAGIYILSRKKVSP